MAQKKKTLKQDKLVEKLVPEPSKAPPEVSSLFGFLGKSSQDGYWRLYLTSQLNEYIEIAETDIIESESLATEENQLGGTQLWVKRDAKLNYTRIESHQVQAEFLKGDISSKYFTGEISVAFLNGGGGLLQDTPQTGVMRTCKGEGHILTYMDGSCRTQNGCTELPECPHQETPHPRPPLPPLPPYHPQFRPTNPWEVCTRNHPQTGHLTHKPEPYWCPAPN